MERNLLPTTHCSIHGFPSLRRGSVQNATLRILGLGLVENNFFVRGGRPFGTLQANVPLASGATPNNGAVLDFPGHTIDFLFPVDNGTTNTRENSHYFIARLRGTGWDSTNIKHVYLNPNFHAWRLVKVGNTPRGNRNSKKTQMEKP